MKERKTNFHTHTARCLHATGTERIDAVRATARAAAAQVRVLRDVDEHLADELGGAR